MNFDPNQQDESSGMRPAIAMQLFTAILGQNAHPIDRLAARCAAADGVQWSSEILARNGSAPNSVDGWLALKNLVKSGIDESRLHSGDPTALEAFFQYISAIAGALAVDGTLITKISPAEIRRALNIIGPLTEPSCRERFSKALFQLDQITDSGSPN